jgi:ABC-type cobalt transport system substrate-binding protein
VNFESYRIEVSESGGSDRQRQSSISRVWRKSWYTPYGDPAVTSHTGEILSGRVAALKAQLGNDIWLFGGGPLFGFLLDARRADMVELKVSLLMLASG